MQCADDLAMKTAVIVPFFNGGELVRRVVDALLRQDLPAGAFEIVVVDDGSVDGSTEGLAAMLGRRGRVVSMGTNAGRCVARNAGAAAAGGASLLVFMDGDCIASPNLVAAHVAACAGGADVSFGDVSTQGGTFWSRVQEDAAERRVRQFRAGSSWALTSANFAIRRDLFVRLGGFDPAFNRHGFEDRDLFARLARTRARGVLARQAKVFHEDRISLASVARKLGESGFHAAHVFRERHPVVYAGLPFSKIDCAMHPWLKVIDRLFWPIAKRIAAGDDRWLEWGSIPFRARLLLARAIYGLWFLHGTARRLRGNAG